MTSNKKLCLCLAYVVICSGKNDSDVTVSFSGCHWQCGAIILMRSGSEASPGHCGANRSFSNMENDGQRTSRIDCVVWKRSADTLKASLEEAGT